MIVAPWVAAVPLACASSPTNGFTTDDGGGEAAAASPDGSADGGGMQGADGSPSSHDGAAEHDGASGSGSGGGSGSGSGGGSGSGSGSGSGGDASTAGDSATGGDSGNTPPPDAAPDAPAITTPWDISWCPGAQITQQQVLAIFQPAATSATLGTVTLDAQQRACQDQTGCQGWTSTTTVPLYDIHWTGSGFDFISGADIAVPATGTATCTVPGPNCTVTIGAVTSGVYPPSQGSFLWSVSPSLSGTQAQVGNWSSDPSGDYITWGTTTTTATCLFGTENGRVYGSNGTYTEYQMVIFGSY